MMTLAVCANPSVDSYWYINQLNRQEVNRSQKETFFAGGKGLHVAFALKELNFEVTALGVWGGPTGVWLQQQCKVREIETIGPRVEQWNRMCLTLKATPEWDDTEILGSGPSLTEQEIKIFDSAFHQSVNTQAFNAVTISGSVPGGFDVNCYRDMISMAKEKDIPVFVDASGPLLGSALHAHPFAVHINRHEGEKLCGSINPIEISRWLSSKCTVSAVTAGADGLYLAYDNNTWHSTCSIEPENITSTVGAGDCLLAGLSSAINTSDNPEYWARFATACGAANCIHPDIGMFSRNDVDKLLGKVKLKLLT